MSTCYHNCDICGQCYSCEDHMQDPHWNTCEDRSPKNCQDCLDMENKVPGILEWIDRVVDNRISKLKLTSGR